MIFARHKRGSHVFAHGMLDGVDCKSPLPPRYATRAPTTDTLLTRHLETSE